MAPSPRARQLFEIRRSGIHGRGAFATRRIRKGTRIVEYIGERITPDEADRRYDDDRMARHHTFLFTVSKRTVVDAGRGGNAARFINHSCAPNCEAVIVGGRIFIEAIRTIAPGEELTYDYQYEREGYDEDSRGLYPCRCGAASCRGTILKPPRRASRATRSAAPRAERARPARRRGRPPGRRLRRPRPTGRP